MVSQAFFNIFKQIIQNSKNLTINIEIHSNMPLEWFVYLFEDINNVIKTRQKANFFISILYYTPVFLNCNQFVENAVL